MSTLKLKTRFPSLLSLTFPSFPFFFVEEGKCQNKQLERG